ncbi:hypothetical protein [Nitratiruptor tergarcus]|uniref:Uncharacterized protein n=1 Tax=Nitratiruptor tergarcus DSM 16512 TaxID=1069081 RepID=A0A1W1WV97_9BACT|nr:hypothetical protein [Nitratiruptor tergarcus]SMC10166.1 hypothetical protein SAMN05660197_2008 [Nitratiruptor tergarcus DSM 16512]
MSLKKAIISGAAALALTGGAAIAANIATDGTGDYLIAPVYYAVGPWKTEIKVVNTNTTKAVVAKVVVRGGKDSKELVDFPIYLTPGDVWDAVIYKENGNVYIESHDDSLMLGQKQVILTVRDDNASGDCVENNITLIEPVLRADVDGFKKNLSESAANADDQAERGYVEVLGLAAYDPQGIINEINSSVFHWSEGCEFNKTVFYTGARIWNNANDLNDSNASDVSGADLTGEQTIYANATEDKDKRFMKLQMLAIEDLATEPKTDGVLGPDTSAISSTYSDTTATGYSALFNKKHVYVLYEGNEDQTEIAPMQVLFTYPYMKPNITEYNISTADTMFRDMTELAQACEHNPCHTSIYTNFCPSNGGSSTGGTNPEDEISAQTPPEEEHPGCPVITVDHEVGTIFDHDPSGGFNDPYVTQYAFKTGGYIDIDLSTVPTNDGNKTGLPVIPTTLMAKDIGGLYLNNHLYNPYNR